MTTRELILRDKRMHKVHSLQIEIFSFVQLKELIEFLCVKLDVKSVVDLVKDLDDIEETIRLIPQMQKVYLI